MGSVLVKIGGSTVDAIGLLSELAKAIDLLRDHNMNTIVVHGGGKDIAKNLSLLNKDFHFIEGMRVTDKETMKVVQQTLCGDVNKRIVNVLLKEGLEAVGISGLDGNLFTAKPLFINGRDIGYVGTISKVNTNLITTLQTAAFTPVISPVSRDDNGIVYNVNADLAASELSIAMKMNHLIFISDVAGVLINGEIRSEISTNEVEDLISKEYVTGGMIPKLRSACNAIYSGVGKVHICGWNGYKTIIDELNVSTAKGTVIC